jgi:hypothetical protein
MNYRNERAEPASPARSNRPLPERTCLNVIIQTRGEPGTRLQASPDSHNTHFPDRKNQGVC